MFIGNPPTEFPKRKSNNNEILEISGALSGSVHCCYKLGINKLTGDLYYRDINNTWQPVPNGGAGGVQRFGVSTEDHIAGQNRNFTLDGFVYNIIGNSTELIGLDTLNYESLFRASDGNSFSSFILNSDLAGNNVQFAVSATDNTNLVQVAGDALLKVINLGADNGVSINSSYYLPLTDGTAGQVITTDGAGNATWQNGGGGGGGSTELQVNAVDNADQTLLNLEDTNSIEFTDNGAGSVTSDVIISTEPNNGVLSLDDGLFAVNPIKYGLVYGGIVTWTGTGYVYEATASGYYLNGVFYQSPAHTVANGNAITLAAPDATFDRIDVFYVDNTSEVHVLQGTPSSTPTAPSLTAGQLQLSFALVETGTTSPTTITEEQVYLEDSGEPTEWTASTNAPARINLASTNTPPQGTVCIEATLSQNGDTITFVNDAPITVDNLSVLTFKLEPKAQTGTLRQKKLRLSIKIGSTLVGNVVNLNNGTFGYNVASQTIQTISIPLTAFGITSADSIDTVFIQNVTGGTGTNNKYGFFIDNMKFQSLPVAQQGTVNTIYNADDSIQNTDGTGGVRTVNLNGKDLKFMQGGFPFLEVNGKTGFESAGFDIENGTGLAAIYASANTDDGYQGGIEIYNGANNVSLTLSADNNTVSYTAGTHTFNGLMNFANYGSGTNTGTPTYAAAFDASGNIIETVIGGAYTASNGLTMVSNDVQLGGTLTVDTIITAGAFSLSINGTGSQQLINIAHTDGIGLIATSVNNSALVGISTNSVGGIFQSTNSFGLNVSSENLYAATFNTSPASTNTIEEVIHIGRLSTGTADVGMGASIAYQLQRVSTGGIGVGELSYVWEDPANLTATSKFVLTTMLNGAAPSSKLEISGAGIFTITQGLQNFSDDTAAATGGIPVNGLYRNGSVVQIRVS